MRTRTKYDGPDYTAATSCEVRSATRADANSPWSVFSDWGYGGTVPLLLTDEGEYIITDDITPSNGVKQVTHTKRKFSRSLITSYDEFTATNRYQVRSASNVHAFSWGAYGKLDFNQLQVSYPKSVNQLKVEAMHKFHKMNEVDTLLNIVESPQLITSARSIFDLIRNHGKRVWTPTGRRRNNALLKVASSGFLAYSFGIAPLLSDIKKINGALAQIKRDMDRYIRDGNREYTVTSKCIGVLTPNITATGYGISTDTSKWWHVGINPLILPTRLVGVRGRRAVEYNTEGFKKLDYVLKRFFATGPASLAWERIPFSFVVDWFVNLSGVVDALDNALTGNSRHINSIWMSEKWHALVPVYKHKYGGWTSDSDGKQTALNELSYYHREAVSPDLSISLSGRFGKKQVALTAALLHQLVANLRVWR